MRLDASHYVAQGALAAPIRERAAGVLARAFQGDPMFSCLLPSENRRKRALPHLFAPMLRDATQRGAVLTMPNAVLTWLPAQKLCGNLVTYLLHGYGSLPLYFGITATLRLQAHEDWCNERIVKHGSVDAAYIQSVAVEPDQAGQGLGSQLVANALSRIGASHRICVLRTEQPRNVRFYERVGFRCVEHVVRRELGIPTWFFVRELPAQT